MKRLSLTLLMVLSVFKTFNVMADEVRPFKYFGVSMQHNSYDNMSFTPGFDKAVLSPNKLSTDDGGLGFRGFAGHHFNQYIAVEGGISFFGKAKFKLTNDSIDAAGNTVTTTVHDGNFSSYGADARVVATYPLTNKWFVKAHVGALLWHNKSSFLVQSPTTVNINSTKDSGASLLTGVGLGYGVNKKWAVAMDFEQTEINKITTKSLGLSVSIRF